MRFPCARSAQDGNVPVANTGSTYTSVRLMAAGDTLSGRHKQGRATTLGHRLWARAPRPPRYLDNSSCSAVEKAHALRSDRGRSSWMEFAEDGRWRIVLASGAVIPSVGEDWVGFTMPRGEYEGGLPGEAGPGGRGWGHGERERDTCGGEDGGGIFRCLPNCRKALPVF